MRTIWNIEGVYAVCTGVELSGDPAFEGTALRAATQKGMYTWLAYPRPEGYYITVRSQSNRVEGFQGATFNLGLEVVTAINRSL